MIFSFKVRKCAACSSFDLFNSCKKQKQLLNPANFIDLSLLHRRNHCVRIYRSQSRISAKQEEIETPTNGTTSFINAEAVVLRILGFQRHKDWVWKVQAACERFNDWFVATFVFAKWANKLRKLQAFSRVHFGKTTTTGLPLLTVC